MGGSNILGSAPFGAYEKGTKLLEASCAFSEFGMRRRHSYHSQDLVVSQLVIAWYAQRMITLGVGSFSERAMSDVVSCTSICSTFCG
jgi:hypothetical protein